MSREIKFRGRGDNNWHYGGYTCLEGAEDAYICGFGLTEPTDEGHQDNYINTIPVDHETVGQYTGLQDRNGVDIFEDDILRTYQDGIIQIIYSEDICAYESKSDIGSRSLYGYLPDSFEVIGNIHENPELLENK